MSRCDKGEPSSIFLNPGNKANLMAEKLRLTIVVLFDYISKISRSTNIESVQTGPLNKEQLDLETLLLGLETFSYHLAFAYGKMNILNFIERTAELGLDGVQINVDGDELAHLGSDDSKFLREVQATIDSLGVFVELDTSDTNP